MAQQLTTYDRVSRLNHWVVALLMIGMLIFGFYVFRAVPSGPEKGALIGIHKAVGLIVLVLGSWRVVWRLRQGFVKSLQNGWQDKAAHLAHWVLLAGIVVMPVTGVVGSFFGGRAIDFFGVFTIPAVPKVEWLSGAAYQVHVIMAFALVATVIAHVAGAIKHHVFDKDDTMKRMVGRV
ncbi:MAG: cytochrome b [Shimia sp.]|uniref:cytochrome b n=1 Tax=Shimia sp. TaxID=1954381 RepID=UPI0040589CC2